MILYGRFLSPYTRRVAISMRLLGIDYEHRLLAPWDDQPAVQAVNPVGQVPALVLDDGTLFVDSSVMLQYLDDLAGPDRALVPTTPSARRRQVQSLLGLALGSIDKGIDYEVEKIFRPEESRSPVFLERFADQSASVLGRLEMALEGDWLDGVALTQADITAAVGFTFMEAIVPELVPAAQYPRLAAHAARCSALAAFTETPLETP
jgi:glutathione S-transferase